MTKKPESGSRRNTLLALAYAGLLILLALDWYVARVHIGAVAIVPLLVIAFYGGRTLAVATAIPCSAIFALLDHDVFTAGHAVALSIPVDALILAASFLAAVVVVERLRHSAERNALLLVDMERLRTSAERDVLTTLPNRVAYTNRIEQLVRLYEATGVRFALLFADLDGFKAVNDELGHGAGDRLLVLAAERIKYAMRSADLVSRIGGDEFAAVLESITGRSEAESIAAKIEQAFDEPFRDGDHTCRIGITIGVSVCGEDANDAERLLRVADEAMYARKRSKKLSM